MGARVIDGRAVAASVRARVADGVRDLAAAHNGRTPGLATVLAGDDPASELYVRRKGEASEEVGIRSIHHRLGSDAEPGELVELVDRLGADAEVDGILVQLPLPPGHDQDAVIARIDPAKDVDGLTATSAGLLAQGRPGLVPSTPRGIVQLLAAAGTELAGAEAVIVGRSILVGRPLASLFLNASATVTVCHSRTRDLAGVWDRLGHCAADAGGRGGCGASRCADHAVRPHLESRSGAGVPRPCRVLVVQPDAGLHGGGPESTDRHENRQRSAREQLCRCRMSQ